MKSLLLTLAVWTTSAHQPTQLPLLPSAGGDGVGNGGTVPSTHSCSRAMVRVYPQPVCQPANPARELIAKSSQLSLPWRMTPGGQPLPLSTAMGACRSVVTPV